MIEALLIFLRTHALRQLAALVVLAGVPLALVFKLTGLCVALLLLAQRVERLAL